MQAKFCESTWIVCLEKGENMMESLRDFCQKNHIFCGSIQGIGALEEVEIGFFCMKTKIYQNRIFHGEWELISLMGNISVLEDKPFIHLHTLLGGADYQTIGGHLQNAIVAITVEMFVTPLPKRLSRTKDPHTGLNLWAI